MDSFCLCLLSLGAPQERVTGLKPCGQHCPLSWLLTSRGCSGAGRRGCRLLTLITPPFAGGGHFSTFSLVGVWSSVFGPGSCAALSGDGDGGSGGGDGDRG